jgi:hypothetical protein
VPISSCHVISRHGRYSKRGCEERKKCVGSQEDIEQGLADAGWELDGGFSEHLVIGYDGDISILVDRRSWDGDDPAYELYDMMRHLSYRVREIPTPNRAATLLKGHGEPPEEE